MLITVAVSTWNRYTLLNHTLEQMTRLVIPAGVDWELLVVNNNCTDATDDVIASFLTRLPVRRFFEPEPGLSNARNTAVREARGDYLLWTDDDTLVVENWLAAYAGAFVRWPEAAVFGGPIRPWFATPPPEWLKRAWPMVCGVYGFRDLGSMPVRFDGGARMPFGANFAVRMREQRRFAYDRRLGVNHGQRRVGEETQLVKTLLEAGYEGWWVPQAGVWHYIQTDHMKIRHIRRHCRAHGQYCAQTEPVWEGPVLFGKPRWVWKCAVIGELRYRLRRLFCQPEVWIRDLIGASEAWGRLQR